MKQLNSCGPGFLHSGQSCFSFCFGLWVSDLLMPQSSPLLGMVSAASIFWVSVPESFSIGSLLIIVVLCLAALAERTKPSPVIYTLINVLALSITVTNWMVGIFATILNTKWWRALLIIGSGFLVVTFLWGFQKLIFPTTKFFIGNTYRVEKFVSLPESNQVTQVIFAFISHTIVMPAIKLVQIPSSQIVMSVQQSNPGSGSGLGLVTTAAWFILLIFGVWAGFSTMRDSPIIRLVGLTTLGQLGLHILFGRETFLYSIHFLPLLLVIAASVTLTRFRVFGLILAGFIIIGASINNNIQFNQALVLLNQLSH